MKSLSGKVALITGVSRRNGIGFGVAKRLAASGCDLFLQSFTPYDKEFGVVPEAYRSDAFLQELRDIGVRVESMEADFEDPRSSNRVLDSAAERFGHLDILIVNHTRDTLLELQDLTAEEIDKHLAINVRAALLLVQGFNQRHDGRPGGRVILMTSGQHLGPMPHLAYVASKGALHQLTASLSNVLIDKAITVNTINPGPTKTYTPSEELDRTVLERMPHGRWGEPDDAARLICWLVSDEAMWVTGQVINSEGGFGSR